LTYLSRNLAHAFDVLLEIGRKSSVVDAKEKSMDRTRYFPIASVGFIFVAVSVFPKSAVIYSISEIKNNIRQQILINAV
jgi:hypothetical protein